MSKEKRKAPNSFSPNFKKQKTEHNDTSSSLINKKSTNDRGTAAAGLDGDRKAPATNGHAKTKNDWQAHGHGPKNNWQANGHGSKNNNWQDKNSSKTSKEAHAKQRALAQERKAAKPNADNIQQAKKLWEQLRRKSHVPKEQRDQLVAELFSIVTGNVRDFVFKHDSVRVIQCAIKYATPLQKKAIALELKGEYRALAESRYAKFLIAKLLVVDDDEIRSMILGEFKGSVKRLINHPEASWILDDSYRQIAKREERAGLLREWYGPEFSLFSSNEKADADLVKLLEAHPEKRKPIMEHLFGMINQLIQKKMTGFTMLHDAMLQYSLVIGSPESSDVSKEFMTLLTDTTDDEGDLLKNLAFTKSGSRVICRALAFATAKDRKSILKVYKEHIETLMYDVNGMHVLLAAYEVVDDTVMTSKLIFPELLATKQPESQQRYDAIVAAALNATARIPLLYPFAVTGSDPLPPKWLIHLGSDTAILLDELRVLRKDTSKKEASLRLQELARAASKMADGVLLATIENRAAQLVENIFGCQLIAEVLLSSAVEVDKEGAIRSVAALASGDPREQDKLLEQSEEAEMPGNHISKSSAAGRMLRSLVAGTKFDITTRTLLPVDPPLAFANIFAEVIQGHVVEWATGESSYVVANLLENELFKTEGGKTRKTILKNLEKRKTDVVKASKAGNKGAAAVLELL